MCLRERGFYGEVENLHMIIMERYNFNDIEIVVDSSMEKWGRVFKDDYVIKNPCILHDLKPEMYFIIVASLEYKDEICKYISDTHGNSFPICGLVWRDLIFEYESFVDMCVHDESVKNILLREGQLNQIGDLQNEIDSLIKDYIDDVNLHTYRVIPNNGNSLTFAVDEKIFVKKKKGNPVSIARYCSGNIDWNLDANIKCMLEELHELHESVHERLPVFDLNETINKL